MADHAARLLRREIMERERGRGKRYPRALREQVTRWLRARVAAGGAPRSAAAAIGISYETARRWLRAEVATSSPAARTDLLPVEIIPDDDAESVGDTPVRDPRPLVSDREM